MALHCTQQGLLGCFKGFELLLPLMGHQNRSQSLPFLNHLGKDPMHVQLPIVHAFDPHPEYLAAPDRVE